jgi:hypothetical protein
MPRWDGRRSRYEVWFLTLSGANAGYWIRYTLRAPIAGPPEPRLWFARFDPARPEGTFGMAAPAQGIGLGRETFEVSMGQATLRSGAASGSVEGGEHAARWDVRFETGGPTHRLLPGPLYGGAAPTVAWSPNPSVRFEGEIEWDGRVEDISEATGQQGHVFGSRHGERWAWASAIGEDGVAFHALSAQGRRGPLLTPFLTSAGVLWRGEWVRLHAISRTRSWGLGWWRIALRNRRYRLEASVRADPERMLRVRYEDPDDTPRWCHHTELASVRMTLWERRAGGWSEVVELDGGAHAEWAGRTPAGAVPRELLEVA